jgi:DNA topoisomerase-1
MTHEPPVAEMLEERCGLLYTTDEMPGYRRRRCGGGFVILDSRNRRVQGAAVLRRIKQLVIPPAWTDVWICPEERGHIQATGRDAKGRKQYIYHPDWESLRNETKFARMQAFGAVLPRIRARVDADLSRRGFPLERVAAVVVGLLDQTSLRIGNREYERRNDSYGIVTLKDEHVETSGAHIHIAFNGKSGKPQEVDLQNRRLARLVRQCQELPGQALFQYQTDAGVLQPLGSSDVNRYLKEVSGGEEITAKDFRTWGASVFAAEALNALGPEERRTVLRRNISDCFRATATRIGNTATVCRKYYVHPLVIEGYERGSIFAAFEEVARAADGSGLSPAERAFLKIIAAPERRTAAAA